MKKFRLLSFVAALLLCAFTAVAQTVTLSEATLGADGGTLKFTESVTLANDAASFTCYVVGKELKSIATQATIAATEDKAVLAVTYADTLEAGAYVLQIPAEKITDFAGADVEFTVEGDPIIGEGLTLNLAELAAEGGKLTFSEFVAFVPDSLGNSPESITCYVVGKEFKNIATQATLTLDWDAWNVINVNFADTLAAGDYVLQIPADMIVANDTQNVFAGADVEFTVEGDPYVGEGLTLNLAELAAEGGKLTFSEFVAFVPDSLGNSPEYITCYVVGKEFKNIATQATLTLDWDAWNVIDVTFADTLAAGDYVLQIPADMIVANDTQNVYAGGNIDFTVEGDPIIGEGLTLNLAELAAEGGKLTFSEFVAFVPDSLGNSPESITCYVVGKEFKNIATQATLTLDWDAWNVINVTFADTLAAGDYVLQIPADLIVANDTQNVFAGADVEFTVEGDPYDGPGLTLNLAELTAKGGKLTFSEFIAFADFAEEITCNVSGVKTKNIVAQATLSLDWDDWSAINVTFSETLEAGEYTLDIPAGVIIDSEQGTSVYAGGKIAFTVEVTTGIANTTATYKVGKFLQNGKIVIVKDGKQYNVNGTQLK